MTAELVPAAPDDLGPVDRARATIAKAVAERDIAALLDLRHQAEAVDLFYRRQGSKQVADDAGEIKVRAERGIGQIDVETSPQGGDRRSDDFQVRSSPNLVFGIDKDARADWRNRLAPLSDQRLDELIDQARLDEHAGVSTARIIQLIRFGSTMSSTTFECYTPAVYVEAARDVLGEIDLDPASSAEANQTIKATSYFDAEDDGLAQDWHGRVWLNPPYGRSLTADFVTKLVDEYDAGRVVAGIALINAYGFDAAWCQPLFDHVFCFTDHRINFYGGGPTFGSLFVYLGDDPHRFAEVFSQFGNVVRRWP